MRGNPVDKNARQSIAEQRYISLRENLVKAEGIRIANKILKLVRHFYSAPTLQILGYVVTILREDGINFQNHQLLNEIVQKRAVEEAETSHSLACDSFILHVA